MNSNNKFLILKMSIITIIVTIFVIFKIYVFSIIDENKVTEKWKETDFIGKWKIFNSSIVNNQQIIDNFSDSDFFKEYIMFFQITS